jgi:hypothetical protein
MQPHRATAVNDSFHVLIRFGIRLAILIALAFLVQIGFAQALIARGTVLQHVGNRQARGHVRARAHPLGRGCRTHHHE